MLITLAHKNPVPIRDDAPHHGIGNHTSANETNPFHFYFAHSGFTVP